MSRPSDTVLLDWMLKAGAAVGVEINGHVELIYLYSRDEIESAMKREVE